MKYLEKKLNKKIKILNENIFELKKMIYLKILKMKIVFLENIRFYEEEEKNDQNFSKHLAEFADLYVNDAFFLLS